MNIDIMPIKQFENGRETMENVRTKIAVLICLLMQPIASAQASELKPYEMPRSEVVPIQESGTDRQYELYIKLPEDYAENTDTRYPVIYTTDAEVHMDMLSGSTEFLMPEVILVGISYQKNHEDQRVNISRFRDYTTVESTNPETQTRYQPGQASNHLRFIRDEVIPYVEKNYRTNPAERSYFGYSLGGAFGAYILLSKPDSFKNYILGSPAFNDRSAKYIDELEVQMAPEQQKMNANVFVSLGEKEENAKERVEGLMSVLKRRSGSGVALTGLEIIEESDHSAAFPETAIRGVRWLAKLNTVTKPYLGQKLPGLIPEAFAPGLVSTERWEYGGVFSPDMKEFYLLKDDENEQTSFVVFQYESGEWRDSPISRRVGQPFISPDGETMHLGKRYKERTESGWSEIKNLGGEFEDIRVMRLTASAKGTYYFDEAGTDGDGRIRYSRLVDGKRETPRLASEVINTGTWLAHPFIAPDESYILWDGRKEGGFGSSDIYVSFRQQDGSWGDAINLGDKINTDAWEASASVTPDGKFLFFHRTVSEGNVDIFWVDAQIVENLRSRQ
ncbi:MAG: alpha/beta hydrolase-fold protein [Parasphingorhabdus sp.]